MMRILIVEDEGHLARLIAEVLGREGYAAEVVGDGRAALARALVELFDLLVVDWMLPDLDGVQVVKRLRAADVGVPVLMLTARSRSWRLLAAPAALIATFYLLMRSVAV